MRRSFLIVSLAVSCTADLPRDAVTDCDQAQTIAVAPNTDVLFVIDDSNSMKEEQENVAANFDKFVGALKAVGITREIQVGVTTTSVLLRYIVGVTVVEDDHHGTSDANFCFDPQGRGGTVYPKGDLVAAPGKPRILKFDSPTFVQDFQANVKVGTCGSGQEQPFEAAKLALQKAQGTGPNAGFMRPGARLAIIVVTDENDCSDPDRQVALSPPDTTTDCEEQESKLGKIDEYAAYFRSFGRDVVFAAIAPVNPATKQPEMCGLSQGIGTRYPPMVQAFGANGLLDSICNTDFGPALVAIAGLLEAPSTFSLAEPPAHPGLLDVAIVKSTGERVQCKLGEQMTYEAPAGDVKASITLSGECKPKGGDSLELHILCAG